jgi:hypothetical protein
MRQYLEFEIEVLGVEVVFMPPKSANTGSTLSALNSGFVPSIQTLCGLNNILIQSVSIWRDRELCSAENALSLGTHCGDGEPIKGHLSELQMT